MRKKLSFLLAIMVTSSVTTSIYAERESFILKPVNVTAMRIQKENIETPADISVFTQEQLANTGEKYVSGALAYIPGVSVSKMGPNDESWITGKTDVILRGVTGGTLFLLDGIPVDFNGVSHLDTLPISAIEKVEVVKGAGATLYGSGAYGGVINVRLKKNFSNMIAGKLGNKDKAVELSTNFNDLSLFASTTHYSSTDKASDIAGTKKFKGNNEPYFFSFGSGQKDSLLLNYRISEQWGISYLQTRKKYSISYMSPKIQVGEMQHFDYNDREKFLSVKYNDNNFMANLYAQQRLIENPDYYTNYPNKLEWEKSNHRVYGGDIRQVWNQGQNTLLLGAGLRYESYKNDNQKFQKFGDSESPLKDIAHFGTYTTTTTALYGQWQYEANEKLTTTLSVRDEWVHANGTTISEMLPQLQVLYRVNDTDSAYFHAGRSFRMPTFRNLFYSSGALAANPDLKPEYGMHYEVGYKHQDEMNSWKISLFKLDIKDQLTNRKLSDGRSQPYNAAKYKNQGVDISYERILSEPLSMRFGALFGNPKQQDKIGNPWKRILGKYQLTNSITYKKDNYGVSLNLSYLGGRVYSNGKDKSPLLTSNLTAWYRVDSAWDLQLSINNLFNRQDATNNNSTYDFYVQERNYAITVSRYFN